MISEKKEAYKCYYPFLDCSPELTALKEADPEGVPVRFIDLPYMEILAGTARDQRHPEGRREADLQ